MVSCIPRISTSLYTIFTTFSFEGLTFKNKRKDLTIILNKLENPEHFHNPWFPF